jgi:ribonuclease HI
MTSAANHNIDVYTDGSCHTQLLVGGWAAILFTGKEKIVLTGTENNTTHNRMELLGVIRAIEYVNANCHYATTINIVSDSQYVIGLEARKKRLSANNFMTKSGKEIPNAGLVKQLLELTASPAITFTKIKAHLKKDDTTNYNIEADHLSRKLVRDAVAALH